MYILSVGRLIPARHVVWRKNVLAIAINFNFSRTVIGDPREERWSESQKNQEVWEPLRKIVMSFGVRIKIWSRFLVVGTYSHTSLQKQ
jgi:hypothetical protein